VAPKPVGSYPAAAAEDQNTAALPFRPPLGRPWKIAAHVVTTNLCKLQDITFKNVPLQGLDPWTLNGVCSILESRQKS